MYSIGEDGRFTSLAENPYKLEIQLQELVAAHPQLLVGEQMDSAAPRRFILVTSEAGIAVSEGSGNVFALDLLFLDQDAILTLVEVKRSSDTRLRREVIGQLLEYAANICEFWSAEKVRGEYERNSLGAGRDVAGALEETLGLEQGSYEGYWASLKLNLDRQRLRLVLVADKIPIETVRIVEYLNRQMTNTDVFAITVSQYRGEDSGARTLVPRLLNPSVSTAQRKASVSAGTRWTRARFYDAIRASEGADAEHVMRKLDEWAASVPRVGIDFGSGTSSGSIQIMYRSNPTTRGYRSGQDVVFLTLWTYGSVEVEFQYLSTFGVFRVESKRTELLERLNAIGLDIPPEKIGKRPNIAWSALRGTRELESFVTVMQWIVDSLSDGG